MTTLREKLINPAYWLGLFTIVFFVFSFTKCSVETISLLTDSDYAIAHTTKVYRGAKMERMISYYYVVNGEVYTSAAERNEQFQIGSRYVVRYGKFSPNGNKFLENIPVPDSIRQDTGRVWRDFLRRYQL